VRYGDWKLHHYFEDDGMELYNLREDVNERKNLAIENPEKLNELFTLLNNWRQEVRAPIPTQVNPAFELESQNQ
jgi:arylsulfatase A-like enzyme